MRFLHFFHFLILKFFNCRARFRREGIILSFTFIVLLGEIKKFLSINIYTLRYIYTLHTCGFHHSHIYIFETNIFFIFMFSLKILNFYFVYSKWTQIYHKAFYDFHFLMVFVCFTQTFYTKISFDKVKRYRDFGRVGSVWSLPPRLIYFQKNR